MGFEVVCASRAPDGASSPSMLSFFESVEELLADSEPLILVPSPVDRFEYEFVYGKKAYGLA